MLTIDPEVGLGHGVFVNSDYVPDGCHKVLLDWYLESYLLVSPVTGYNFKDYPCL